MNGATMCLCIQIYLFHMMNNPSQRRRGKIKKCKTSNIVWFYAARKFWNNHPMVPPLDHFQGRNKNYSSLARTISASRRSFFANLTTFEWRSGLKFFSILKIAILEMGWLSKFQSHRSWGDAHLSLGAAQAPPN